MKPDESDTPAALRDLLTRGEEKERAAAIASVIDTLARMAGVSWEAVLAARGRRGGAPAPDTDWEPLPPVEGWPGCWRRLNGHTLAVREHGRHGFYATVDGFLVPIARGRPLVPSAYLAMQASEEFAEHPDICGHLGVGPELEQV